MGQKQKIVSVVYFGSSRISVLIGVRGANNSLVVKGRGTVEYAGYMDGEFLELDNLKYALGTAIDIAEKNCALKIDKLYVGVPADFSVVHTGKAEYNFMRDTRINKTHTENILKQINLNGFAQTHTLINRSPIYYNVNGGRKIINPVGSVGINLSVLCSFIFAEKQFIKTVKDVLFALGIAKLHFASVPLALSLFLLPENVRDNGALFLHSGLLTTSVFVVSGDGLINLKSIGSGKGYIVSDLMEILEVNYNMAKNILEEAALSIETKPSDNYVIFNGEEPVKFEASYVNDIIKARLEMIAENIQSTILGLDKEYLSLPIYIAGGEIDAVNGGRDYLAKCLGVNIYLAKNIFTKAGDVAANSLLDLALLTEK
ncbi:MAG: hypothetical protein FWD32_00165 [Firmicutes bacterium]|nr:hypothetical protein [Bacillota bacterium]